MIQVEGYKAFRGTIKVVYKNPAIEPQEISGDWLYKPDTGYWYCGGRSFRTDTCTIINDDTK